MKWRMDPQFKTWLPRLQAHRGYWFEGLQQNSLAAIQEAQRRHFQMVEFDVRLTKDKKVVLFHDEKYQGRLISSLNLTDLQTQARPDYPKISTLDEVLTWLKESLQNHPRFDFKLNIELKSRKIWDGQLEREVSHLIRKYRLERQILISSFNPFSLFRFRRLDPQIYRALLLTEDRDSNFILKKMWLNFLCLPDVLNLRYQDFTEEKYAAISRDVPIVLWTVNGTDEVKAYQQWVFGVISDQITPTE